MSSDDRLPIGAHITCLTCGHQWDEKYDPPTTISELYNKEHSCKKCGSICKTDPLFEHESEQEDGEKKQTKAKSVLEIAGQNINKLFVDEYQEPHAAISVNGHLETIPILGRRFRNYLASIAYKNSKMVIDSNTLRDVAGILSAKAQFDNPDQGPITLNLRVASGHDESGNPVLYYDLTNKKWEFIQISSSGWKIVNNQILFHRYNNQLAQVYPSKDYSPDIFDKFISLELNKTNVDEDKLAEYQILLKCYIICAFIAGFPKAIPMSNGTQGAAKTTLMENVKMIIDPCIAKTFSFPRDNNELVQQLSHNYVTFYDNISEMKDWISDELCRAVSGSGSSKRRLYTDEDDLIRSLMRCVGLNGINLAATKADMLDGDIFFKLKRIPDEDRRYVLEIQKEFEAMRPQLLGYILDILVEVKKWKEVHGDLKVSKIPRMADWAANCEIISQCMGNEEGQFLRAYEENAKIQTEQVMETSLVATCIAHFVDTDPMFNGHAMVKDLEGKPLWGWVGVATSLKGELETVAEVLKIDTKSKGWPRTPTWLIRRINEILHTLKEAGIEIAYDYTTRGKKNIMIRKLPLLAMIALQSENHAQKDGDNSIAISNAKNIENEIALQNHAQNDSSNANNANNANLHTNQQKFLKCPYQGCKFENANQETVDHHFKYTHTDYLHSGSKG